MPPGQPPKYKTPAELQIEVDAYFADCETDQKCPNVMGLTHFLGFAATQSLFDQEERGDEYSAIIKRAKLNMWNEKFQFACEGKMNSTIFIFDSINNHGMVNTRSEGKNELTGKDGGPIEGKWTVETVKSEGKE